MRKIKIARHVSRGLWCPLFLWELLSRPTHTLYNRQKGAKLWLITWVASSLLALFFCKFSTVHVPQSCGCLQLHRFKDFNTREIHTTQTQASDIYENRSEAHVMQSHDKKWLIYCYSAVTNCKPFFFFQLSVGLSLNVDSACESTTSKKRSRCILSSIVFVN